MFKEYEQHLQERKKEMLNSGKYSEEESEEIIQYERTRWKKINQEREDEQKRMIEHMNSLSDEELSEAINEIHKENDEHLESEFKRLKVGIRTKELDLFKKDLMIFREKYFNLVGYARGKFPILQKATEKKYPKDIKALKKCTTNFEHGFNSGCLATSRYFLSLILQSSLEDAKKYNYKDNKKEKDEGESSFPFLST
tara:strand:- start:46 stop:636 length:591 start_codon:yes stop_codon:yes gene_type:complete